MTRPGSRLLLFDVDGTLMITKGAGSRCILRACRRLFGDQFEWGGVTVGTLDPQIFADLCTHNAIADSAAHHDRYRDAYLAELEAELAQVKADVTLMPGIGELLAQLRQRADEGQVKLGVVTGNYRPAVELKFAAAGIDPVTFDVMACAEDGDDRPALVRFAMRQCTPPPQPRDVIVIGDTPRDIECAHACGATAFAVATGRYNLEQLQQAGADYVAPDLSSPQPLLNLLPPVGAVE